MSILLNIYEKIILFGMLARQLVRYRNVLGERAVTDSEVMKVMFIVWKMFWDEGLSVFEQYFYYSGDFLYIGSWHRIFSL